MLTQEKLKEYALDEAGCPIRSLIAAFYLARYEERAADCFPDADTAFKFAFTEFAEVVDAQLRLESTWDRNNAKDLDIIGEIYDTILMLFVTAISALPENEHNKVFVEIDRALSYQPKCEPEPPIELLNDFHLTMFSNIKLNVRRLTIQEDATYNHPLKAYQKIESLSTCILEFIMHLLSHVEWEQECGRGIIWGLKGSYIEQFRQHLDRKLTAKNKKNLGTTLQGLKEKCLQN